MNDDSQINYSILDWLARVPGLTSKADWVNWAKCGSPILQDGTPSVNFIPPIYQRRIGRLSKNVLFVAFDCLGEKRPVNTIFCFPHGEFHCSLALLKAVAAGELISPTGFSLCVHNTALGPFLIANDDR